MFKKLLYLGSLLVLFAPGLQAGNVDLVTLPDREGVQLTIYNSEDITLAKEVRYLTFKRGINQLQFSWAGTLIDPSSVEFRPLEHADEIELVDTVFPGQKPQHLLWNLESQYEGQAKVEVTYFTSGLTWSMDYVCQVNPEETDMRFRGYVRVFNRSGEEYEGAEIRLIVGKINLVEKISELARRQGLPMPQRTSEEWDRLRKQTMNESFTRAARAQQLQQKGKAIVKEGLSEYFMFTVEGTETVSNGWSKRMKAIEAEGVEFHILYRLREHQYGPRPVRFFIWKNDPEHQLGESPLPDGLVRLFRENGKDGLSYLGQQLVRYVPIQAELEVNLGPDDLVVHETVRMETRRFNFSFGPHDRVNGWDEEQQWVDTIRNYRSKPIAFELRRIWEGDVEYTSPRPTELFDYHTIEAELAVAAREQLEYPCTVLQHLGVNARQSRIKLK